ncbi:MAG: carboxypeptidase regulatory-like domain-containing protein [Cytophagaceae bacterium]|nr:carboxypeptidase regulatory-like domain-containing protein [Cytophagaceae bacterium]
MKKPLPCLLLWLLILGPGMAQAQLTTTLTGRITDAATGQPLPFASVYINTTTNGTTTDENGNYRLRQVPLGTVELAASYVGYLPARQTLRLTSDQPRTVNLALKASDLTLNDVTIKAKASKAWQRQFRRFKDALLGESAFANQCAIPNGRSVAFTEKGGHLLARAAEPLLIENRALGYRVYYELLHFDAFRSAAHYAGASRFEEITPANPEQAERWQRNRRRAYRGSTRHLLASLIAGTYEQEGFLVYQSIFDIPTDLSPILSFDGLRRSKAIQSDSLFLPGELSFERRFVSRQPLEIFYTKLNPRNSPYRDMPYAYSLLNLPQGTSVVTTDGWVTRPQGMELRGYLGGDRLASLLPTDWRPALNLPSLVAKALAQGQVLPPDQRLDSLARWWNEHHQNPTPTVFLHTDKSLYATGDRLWLSAYVLDARTHQPLANRFSDVDEALHVELLAATGRLVQHQWLRLAQGRTSGDFRLSDTLTSGTYQLRAYTDSEQSSSQPAFERTILIHNWLKEPTRPSARLVDDSLDVQFLPEGGRWVAGLPARLGVKVLDPAGRGQRVLCLIRNAQGREVARLITNDRGMGSVGLTPLPNQHYQATVQGDGFSQTAPLPAVEPEGITLTADALSDSTLLLLRVQASPGYARQALYVVLQSRGELLQQTKFQLLDAKAQLGILMAKLTPGLCQVSLFDATGRPWAERLVFIPERLTPAGISITPDKPAYRPREQAVLTVRLADGADYPLVAQVSASVTDADQVPSDSLSADMRTHLLLTGELHGAIEAPIEYLRDNLPTTRQALDALLLTQGWRRLSWVPRADQVAEGVDSLVGITLTGRVTNRRGRPIPRAKLLLTSANATQPVTYSVGADAQGVFQLTGLVLTDTVRLHTQVMDEGFKSLKASVLLDAPGRSFKPLTDSLTRPDWGKFKGALAAARVRQESNQEQYRERGATQLREVIVRAFKPNTNTAAEANARRISIHGMPDHALDFDEAAASRYSTAYDMLMGRMPGVQVQRRQFGSGYIVSIRGFSSFSTKNAAPLYLVDGNYLEENDEGTALLMINPTTIERIEVLKNSGASSYGSRGGGGVIAFYSRKWQPGKAPDADRASNDLTVLGFPTQRQFYVPRYSGTPEETTKPDRRDVLYWQPLLQTDAQGQVTLTFPLSDLARTLRINIQGITEDGQPVSAEQIVKLKVEN